MGASKNDLIEDSFFNDHFIDDGEHACGSFSTDEYIRRCEVKRKPNVPPYVPFVPLSKEDQARWDDMKLTNEEKDLMNDEYLKKHGI